MTAQPYLTLPQIEAILERVGQPEGSELLNRFFTAYRHRLTSDDVRELYDGRYFEHFAAHPVAEVVGGFPIHQFAWYAFDYLRNRACGKEVLDFGCGHGHFSLALAAAGASHVVGIDADAGLIDAARARVPEGLPVTFEVASALRADGAFDYAVLNDLTEHLSDAELAEVISEVGRVLRPGGKLLIHTPNGLALCNSTDVTPSSRLYVAFLRRFRGWRGFERTAEQVYYDQVHINIKSFRQLRGFLAEHGFNAIVRYDEQARPGFGWLSTNMLVIATRT
jgi:2-polyprenyl-3-methyl-5-hydroxy-6-metoxy-1,4-benzoquinol methylase